MQTSKPNRRVPGESDEQKLFRLLVASVKDYAIFMVDPSGYILTWNQGAQHIKGYREEEVIGRHISIFYTPDDNKKNEAQHNLSEAVANGSYENEGWRVRKDGSLFWANVVFTPLYNERQQLTGFAKITRDVTERKKAEDKRAEFNAELGRRVKENTKKIFANESRFRKLIENSYEGITLIDKDLQPIYSSASAESIMGWKNSKRSDRELTAMVHPGDVDRVKNKLKEALAAPGKPLLATYRTEHKLGHYIWLETLFTNMLDVENVNAIVCNFRDVTEKMQADQLLKKTVKELSAYKSAIDHSAIVAITDQKGIITRVNDNFCRISKYSADELIGRDHRIINSSFHDKPYIANLWKTIARGKIWRGEFRNKAKDGSYYWVDTTIVPFLNEKGKPYQYLSIRFDITERKISRIRLEELNASLRKHVKELAISNAELEQFAYVASHDLQEPLRMVTSFLSQLDRKYANMIDDKGKRYIHFAVDGAKRMRQIILDLLEFSRVGRAEDNIEETDLNKMIGDILALYRKQIEEQNATITFDNLPVLQTYKVPLRQVFQNLIGNSLKYQKTGKPSFVGITAEDLGDYWKFSVTDNGIGIGSEYFDKIFIIFQRLHNKDEYSGTGMGLAITKKIVDNLGGKIWVESEEGKGSTFHFTILKHNKL